MNEETLARMKALLTTKLGQGDEDCAEFFSELVDSVANGGGGSSGYTVEKFLAVDNVTVTATEGGDV